MLHEYIPGPVPASPFGHEVCGEIVEVGPGIEGFGVGERVMSFNRDGYAEFQVTPQDRLLKLPAETTGLLLSSQGLAMLIASFVLGKVLVRWMSKARMISVGFLFMGVALFIISFNTELYVSLAA